MRSLKLMAAVGLTAGLSAFTAHAAFMYTSPTIGVGAQSAALYNDDYHMGYGVDGSLGSTNGMSELDLRANYLNYQGQNSGVSDKNEGGVGLTALVGPNTMYIQPKVGGHVGYTRFEDNNFLDLGPDVSALLMLTPKVGLQATVTPTWLINDNGNDYRTRASIGVKWTPGGA